MTPKRFLFFLLVSVLLTIAVIILFAEYAPRTRAAVVIAVHAGDNLQAKINQAQCADTVLIDAGPSFAPIVFPSRQCSANPITLLSSKASNLPVGKRVVIADGVNMARIVTPEKYPAVTFAGASSGWTFIGVEVTTAPGLRDDQYVSELVSGRNVAPAPSYITFDRCWIHSQEDGTGNPHSTAKIGVSTGGHHWAFNNSRLSVPGALIGSSNTFDNTLALLITSEQYVSVDNTFLSSWFSPLFIGGSDKPEDVPTANTAAITNGTMSGGDLSNVSNLAVGDLMAVAVGPAESPYTGFRYEDVKVTSVVGNHVGWVPWAGNIGGRAGCTSDCGIPLTKAPVSPGDARWRGVVAAHLSFRRTTFHVDMAVANFIAANFGRYPKGVMEIKAADDVLIEGCEATGFPATLTWTQHNQTGPHGGPSPWSAITRLTLRYYWSHPSRSFESQLVSLLLEDNVGTSIIGGDVLVEQCVFETGGWLGDFFAGNGVTIRHITVINNIPWLGGRLLNVTYVPIQNFSLLDSILFNGEYGMNLLDGGSLPGKQVSGNVLVTGTIDPNRPNCGNDYIGNFCPTTIGAVGFVDVANRIYKLAASSAFKGKATDGKDPGADWDAVMAAQSASQPAPSPSPVPSPPALSGIQITSATYGGNAGAVTGNVTNHIAAACNGKTTCSYIVDYRLIGDPTPGQPKAYVVTYRCGGGAAVPSITVPAEAGLGDKAVSLECSPPSPSPTPSPSPVIVTCTIVNKTLICPLP